MKKIIFGFLILNLGSALAGAATYYVDQTNGSDSNAGTSQSAPWKNCPGMGGLRGTGILQAGDVVYFDRSDTWWVSGEYGLHVRGGVRYIGDEWGSGTGTAAIRPSGHLITGLVDVREDHPTSPTVVKGFDLNSIGPDGNRKYGNGASINHPRWTGSLTGATKRFENLHVQNTWSSLDDPSDGNRYFYGIIMRATGGTAGLVSNVEVINCVIEHVSRDGIALYPDDGDANTLLKNILVRGNSVSYTAEDPTYANHSTYWGGLGITAKGQIQDVTIENNFVHDTNAVGIAVAGNQNTHYGKGADNVHIRYNIVARNGTGGIRLATGGGDPKDVKVYGNIAYDNPGLAGFRLDSDLSGTINLRVYNNTFYNAPVYISCPNATFTVFEFKNNVVYSPSGTPITGSNRFTSSSNNMTTDPSFKNTAALPTGFSGTFGVDMAPNADGLSLLSNSPAINAGIALASPYNGSINSTARPQSGSFDMGAYEMGGAPPPVVQAGFHFVRQGATGANNGNDWTNAWTQLPGSLTRGDTYYIADGDYSGHTFDDSGTGVITVKKATTADHGPAGDGASFLSSFDGQAAFGAISIKQSFYVIDGQTRGADWKSGYGFKIKGTGNAICTIEHATGLQQITVRYCELAGPSGALGNANQTGAAIYCITPGNGNSHDITIQYCYTHDVWPDVFVFNGYNITIEYCFIDQNASSSAFHGQNFNGNVVKSVKFRFNKVRNPIGTAVFTVPPVAAPTASDIWIYGNVVFDEGGGSDISAFVENIHDATAIHWRVFNNTLYGIGWWPRVYNDGTGSDNLAYNNLWVNCDSIASGNGGPGVTVDYSAYLNTPHPNDAHIQVLTSNPFVNPAVFDFRLTGHTDPGFPAGSPFNMDMDGHVRSNWDRGAYEFNGAPPPPPTNNHPGDADQNMHMTLNEATQYGFCWKSAPTVPSGCPSGADLNNATRAGLLYGSTADGVYHFDSTQPVPACWVPGP